MGQKYFFASDFHLGAPEKTISLEREKRIIRWLDFIKDDAKAIFLLGDIFDYWYEWKHVIPKYFYRFFTKLAELREQGIEIHYFTGNHDVWQYHYLKDEFGINVWTKPRLFTLNGKKIFCGHGDGLGSGSLGYAFIKWVFTNRVLQVLFTNFFHPNLAMQIGYSWSKRRHQYDRDIFPFNGEKEHIIKYIRSIMKETNADCYIFGHRHLEADIFLEKEVKYINTGCWFKSSPYAVLSNQNIKLEHFEG
ncbi:MAG: UDP-2,3-diacylglucosamine diphosphatase [Bacteroidales bacterium]|jgi:UDP-2,3-diacylglucosamine hydrolase|nr:UDP-2,3-diacylglucosamine diphosphatase [Bacteroidales bacterium]